MTQPLANKMDLTPVMEKMGYTFHHPDFLSNALRHRSCGTPNNERLEFLGDAILDYIVGYELFLKFPSAKEGELSRWRAHLVKEETLATVARSLNLGPYLILGKGEKASGGNDRASILADCLEAITAAIFLDSQDMKVCQQCLVRWFGDLWKDISKNQLHKDPKSLLQELLQSKQMPVPTYRVVKTIGQEHNCTFVIEAEVGLLDHPVEGRSHSRKNAEQAAATAILKELGYGE